MHSRRGTHRAKVLLPFNDPRRESRNTSELPWFLMASAAPTASPSSDDSTPSERQKIATSMDYLRLLSPVCRMPSTEFNSSNEIQLIARCLKVAARVSNTLKCLVRIKMFSVKATEVLRNAQDGLRMLGYTVTVEDRGLIISTDPATTDIFPVDVSVLNLEELVEKFENKFIFDSGSSWVRRGVQETNNEDSTWTKTDFDDFKPKTRRNVDLRTTFFEETGEDVVDLKGAPGQIMTTVAVRALPDAKDFVFRFGTVEVRIDNADRLKYYNFKEMAFKFHVKYLMTRSIDAVTMSFVGAHDGVAAEVLEFSCDTHAKLVILNQSETWFRFGGKCIEIDNDMKFVDVTPTQSNFDHCWVPTYLVLNLIQGTEPWSLYSSTARLRLKDRVAESFGKRGHTIEILRTLLNAIIADPRDDGLTKEVAMVAKIVLGMLDPADPDARKKRGEAGIPF